MMLDSYGNLTDDESDRSEFIFFNVENNRSEETTVQLPEYIATTSLVLCSLVLGIGVLGNLLVIIVVLSNKLLRSSTNLFLLNLSVADLLVLVTCTPTSLVEIATRKDAWIMGKVMCYFVPFVELSVSHTSVLTILAITVERYYAICLPLQAGVVWTKSKACLTCLIAWLFAFGLTAPVLAMIEYRHDADSPVCLTQVDNFWSKFYFIFIIIVFFFIPFLILVLLYRHIARHLVPPVIHPQDPEHSEQVIAESSSVIRSRKQVVAMLIAVVVFFFACILPFKLLTLWIVASPIEIMDVINTETYFNLLYFSRVMFYINSAINPILYNVMSSKFRDGFKRVFNRCRKGTHFYRATNSTYYGHTATLNANTYDSSPRISMRTTNTTSSSSSFLDRMNSSLVLRGSSPTSCDFKHQRSPHKALVKSVSDRGPSSPSRVTYNGNVKVNIGCKSKKLSLKTSEESFGGTRKRRFFSEKKGSKINFNRNTDESSLTHDKGSGSSNILFIEERKILVIPTNHGGAAVASSGPAVTIGPLTSSTTFKTPANKNFRCNPMYKEEEEYDQEETED